MIKFILYIKKLLERWLWIYKGGNEVKPSDYKVVCKYTTVSDKEARGYLYFKDLKIPFISGRYGKGYAPKGLYKAFQLINETRDAFSQHGLGFQVPIEARFKTDRTLLAIHMDGGVVGSLGCIALIATSLDEVIKIHHTFRDYFEMADVLEVEIC